MNYKNMGENQLRILLKEKYPDRIFSSEQIKSILSVLNDQTIQKAFSSNDKIRVEQRTKSSTINSLPDMPDIIRKIKGK